MDEITCLAWLFEQSESELGLRSGFGALEMRLSGVWTTQVNHEMSERQLEAAARSRRILKRLNSLPQKHARILREAYRPKPLPRALVARHGVRQASLMLSRLGPKKPEEREAWSVLALTKAVIAWKRAER